MINKLKENWFLILIVCQPILDIIAYFQYDNVIGSMAGYIRMILMCIIPIGILLKTDKKKSFIIWMSIIGIYCLLHIVNGFRVGYVSIFEDVSYLARVVQMPILAISFMYFYDIDQGKQLKKLPKTFYFNCLLIFVTMCIAHLTNTAQFTYNDYQYGLLGWFANANSQSIIIVSLIPISIYYALKSKNKIFISCTILFTWFLMFSNGTKAAYYAIYIIFFGYLVFLIFEYFIHRKDGRKFPLFVTGFLLVMAITSVLAYPYSPRYQMDDNSSSARVKDQEVMDKDMTDLVKKNNNQKITVDIIKSDEKVRKEIVEYYTPLLDKDLIAVFGAETVLEKYGWLPDSIDITDMRLKKRIYSELLWEESDSITKFVGFEYTKIDGFDLENDYPAIFYYYGYIGFGLYILFLAYFVFIVIRSCIKDFKGSMNAFNFACILTLGLQVGLAQLSGAILRRPNASIYLSIILALLYYRCNRNNKEIS